jgi:hypothetical protein
MVVIGAFRQVVSMRSMQPRAKLPERGIRLASGSGGLGPLSARRGKAGSPRSCHAASRLPLSPERGNLAVSSVGGGSRLAAAIKRGLKETVRPLKREPGCG